MQWRCFELLDLGYVRLVVSDPEASVGLINGSRRQCVESPNHSRNDCEGQDAPLVALGNAPVAENGDTALFGLPRNEHTLAPGLNRGQSGSVDRRVYISLSHDRIPD